MALKHITDTVLFQPAKNGADHLCILAGYATPTMASWLIKNLQHTLDRPIRLSLIVGMVPYDGLSIATHEGFVDLHGQSFPGAVSSFSCSYLFDDPPVHANYYIWLKNDEPEAAFCGSADFVQRAFITNREEIMIPHDPQICWEKYCAAEQRSIYCNHAEIEEYVRIYPTHPLLDGDDQNPDLLSGSGVESVTLSLLTKHGTIGTKSGLNWGQRKHRNPNEAYIPLPAQVARSGFFPLEKQHFNVLTDDGHNLLLRIEQQNDKAITTPMSNAQLGEYFRGRLGVANGAFVTKADLDAYGRTDVTFYRIDDEQYYLDFSSSKV